MNRCVTRALALAILLASAQIAAGQSAGASATAKRYEMVPAPLRSASAPAVPAHPSPYNFSGVQYPRIEEDSRVTFQFRAPDAQKVQVMLVTSGSNSLNPLPYDMVKGDNGVWTYTTKAPQGPGYHNYWMHRRWRGRRSTRAPTHSSATATCATGLKSRSRASPTMTSRMCRTATC